MHNLILPKKNNISIYINELYNDSIPDRIFCNVISFDLDVHFWNLMPGIK